MPHSAQSPIGDTEIHDLANTLLSASLSAEAFGRALAEGDTARATVSYNALTQALGEIEHHLRAGGLSARLAERMLGHLVPTVPIAGKLLFPGDIPPAIQAPRPGMVPVLPARANAEP